MASKPKNLSEREREMKRTTSLVCYVQGQKVLKLLVELKKDTNITIETIVKYTLHSTFYCASVVHLSLRERGEREFVMYKDINVCCTMKC